MVVINRETTGEMPDTAMSNRLQEEAGYFQLDIHAYASFGELMDALEHCANGALNREAYLPYWEAATTKRHYTWPNGQEFIATSDAAAALAAERGEYAELTA